MCARTQRRRTLIHPPTPTPLQNTAGNGKTSWLGVPQLWKRAFSPVRSHQQGFWTLLTCLFFAIYHLRTNRGCSQRWERSVLLFAGYKLAYQKCVGSLLVLGWYTRVDASTSQTPGVYGHSSHSFRSSFDLQHFFFWETGTIIFYQRNQRYGHHSKKKILGEVSKIYLCFSVLFGVYVVFSPTVVAHPRACHGPPGTQSALPSWPEATAGAASAINLAYIDPPNTLKIPWKMLYPLVI